MLPPPAAAAALPAALQCPPDVLGLPRPAVDARVVAPAKLSTMAPRAAMLPAAEPWRIGSIPFCRPAADALDSEAAGAARAADAATRSSLFVPELLDVPAALRPRPPSRIPI